MTKDCFVLKEINYILTIKNKLVGGLKVHGSDNFKAREKLIKQHF